MSTPNPVPPVTAPPAPAPEPNTPPEPDALQTAKEAGRTEARKQLQDTVSHHKTDADTAKAERDAAQAAAKQSASDAEAAKKKVRELETANLTREERTEHTLKELQETVGTLQTTIADQQTRHEAAMGKMADSAISKIRDSDMKAELANLTSGLVLDPALMPVVTDDDTAETLAAKVVQAKATQERISGKAADAADETARLEAVANMPTPLSPNVTSAPPVDQNRSSLPKDGKARQKLAKLGKADYQVQRDKMLADAASTAPDGNMYVR